MHMSPVERTSGSYGYVSRASSIPACHHGSASDDGSAPSAAAIAATTSAGWAGISSTSTAEDHRPSTVSPLRGISLKYPAFTRSGDARTGAGDGDSPLMRHLIERTTRMLQWNPKFALVVLVAVALATMFARAHGLGGGYGGINFTW
jgi:hypothetical protein